MKKILDIWTTQLGTCYAVFRLNRAFGKRHNLEKNMAQFDDSIYEERALALLDSAGSAGAPLSEAVMDTAVKDAVKGLTSALNAKFKKYGGKHTGLKVQEMRLKVSGAYDAMPDDTEEDVRDVLEQLFGKMVTRLKVDSMKKHGATKPNWMNFGAVINYKR
jgi:hypothetical protein